MSKESNKIVSQVIAVVLMIGFLIGLWWWYSWYSSPEQQWKRIVMACEKANNELEESYEENPAVTLFGTGGNLPIECQQMLSFCILNPVICEEDPRR